MCMYSDAFRIPSCHNMFPFQKCQVLGDLNSFRATFELIRLGTVNRIKGCVALP